MIDSYIQFELCYGNVSRSSLLRFTILIGDENQKCSVSIMVSIMVSIGSTTVTFFSFSKVEPTSGIVEPNQQQTMTLTFRRCGVLKRCNFPPHFFWLIFGQDLGLLARFGDFFFLSKILWALVFSGFQIEFQLVLVIVGGLLCFFYFKLATVTLMEDVTRGGFFRTRCFKIFANRLESRLRPITWKVFYLDENFQGNVLAGTQTSAHVSSQQHVIYQQAWRQAHS